MKFCCGLVLSLASIIAPSAWSATLGEEPEMVPVDFFELPEGLEIKVWASSPLFFNPTNIDIDRKGRVWVAEGVRYRGKEGRQPEGDRIVVLEDKDGDGAAESSHIFVQEEALVAPLGVAVIGNQVVVSQPPDLIVYTDTDGDAIFTPGIDKREVLLSGFSGKNHDHSLHSVTAGPDGKWYFNTGNTGALFTDRSGKTFRIAGPYQPKPIGPFEFPFVADEVAGRKSDDGHVYVGGFGVRMNPDGTNAEIIGHNFRNSYEWSVNSFGDVFQNDNDDPPACRVSHVLEYGNAGFASADGKRTWQADRRPGQSIAVAEWRQEDPGTMPAGDVYGGGSPTGNVYYENGALGEEWEGTFFACEPGRNVIFAYQPEPVGAGFRLERSDFATSNPAGDHNNGGRKSRFAGSDFIGGDESVTGELKTLFRPSDIAVGPDGALYVSDWFDGRVGGHGTFDEGASGTIYRIAPAGFQSLVPNFDLETIEGMIAAARSPAVNVRSPGFAGLVEEGDAAVPAVEALLEDENPFIRARAVWLLAAMGAQGMQAASRVLDAEDPRFRLVAARALRRKNYNVVALAKRLSKDPAPALRAEAALWMRDVSLEKSRKILVEVAAGFDGKDRTYLEALGIGATGKEADVYAEVFKEMGGEAPEKWPDAIAWIAWRLHPEQAMDDLTARAATGSLDLEARRRAMDAIAFMEGREAAEAMVELAAAPDSPLAGGALWWLLNRATNRWENHDLIPILAERGLYDPSKVVLQEVISPDPDAVPNNSPSVEEILKLEGDEARGKVAAQRCIMCHRIEGIGIEYGPTLTGWGRMQTREVIVTSIVNPSAEIAHGYDGTEIVTKDGKTIHGLLIKDSNPFMITSMGGMTQVIPGEQIEMNKELKHSLMMSAAQLGLSAQDVADITAYLKAN